LFKMKEQQEELEAVEGFGTDAQSQHHYTVSTAERYNSVNVGVVTISVRQHTIRALQCARRQPGTGAWLGWVEEKFLLETKA